VADRLDLPKLRRLAWLKAKNLSLAFRCVQCSWTRKTCLSPNHGGVESTSQWRIQSAGTRCAMASNFWISKHNRSRLSWRGSGYGVASGGCRLAKSARRSAPAQEGIASQVQSRRIANSLACVSCVLCSGSRRIQDPHQGAWYMARHLRCEACRCGLRAALFPQDNAENAQGRH